MKCECGEPAEHCRSTQFAGDHYFCDPCAKQQKDFGQTSCQSSWSEVKLEPIETEHVPSIRIEDEHGGFVIVIDGERFMFDDDESDRSDMVKVFKHLGFKDVSHEEVY